MQVRQATIVAGHTAAEMTSGAVPGLLDAKMSASVRGAIAVVIRVQSLAPLC
jgi:hypothetical protein